MGKAIDMQGKTFNRLVVESFAGRDTNGKLLYNVLCVCGIRKEVRGADLRRDHTKSCGCLEKELAGTQTITHGMCGTPTYSSWAAMVNRCTNSKDPNFKDYGHLGTAVFEAWLTFSNFFSSMGERPEGTSLGRVLDRGNYEPGNAFWQTTEEQQLSKRNNHALAKWEERQLQ